MNRIVDRDIFPEVVRELSSEKIIVLLGPRQVGKTTLLTQLATHLHGTGVPEGRVKRFNLDVVTDRAAFADQAAFIEYLRAESGRDRCYVFVDEAQRIENPGIFFKGIYDLRLPVKLVLSGSSALDIRSRIHEALTGRKRAFSLHPFSFREALRATNPDLLAFLNDRVPTVVHAAALTRAYERYLVTGGYPDVVLASDAEAARAALAELYESYIAKDVVGFLQIANPDAVTRCLEALALQVGGLVNVQEMATLVGVTRQTIMRYLAVFVSTFLCFPVRPYATNPRTELTKMRKWYFRDTGLRNFITGDLAPWASRRDRGALLENACATALDRTLAPPNALRFWRTKAKAEVDFVIPTRPPIPVEVKQRTALRSGATRALSSFLERYASPRGCIVGFPEPARIRNGGASDPRIVPVLPWHVEEIARVP